jgi:hypothetical protein
LTDSAFARKPLIPQSFHRGLEPTNLFMVLPGIGRIHLLPEIANGARTAKIGEHAIHRRDL